MNGSGSVSDLRSRRRLCVGVVIVALFALALASCNERERSGSEPYYAEPKPPRKQEFRWSNGRPPKTMDPARAVTPPETDLVRAVYEGLTELDTRTLEAKPALAESWTSSEDKKIWRFRLRPTAVWSNGRPVTADDMIRSWKRLAELGSAVPHHELLTNIVGFPVLKRSPRSVVNDLLPGSGQIGGDPLAAPDRTPGTDQNSNSNIGVVPRGPAPAAIGLAAPDPQTLQVTLIAPDKDLPKLFAHPVFRPVFGDGSDVAGGALKTNAVTNGAFRIAAVDGSGVTLERSETYWDRDAVKLERVKFVTVENAEAALEAYRSGELDAITNADFEPLALKLLEPFEDFRRRTHAAVNFYEFNHGKPPFDDRRVRQALAISIERERLTEGEMEGQTQPALSFLPFTGSPEAKITQDKERAVELLAEAGFPGGEGFPVVRLVVNRNYTQERIGRAVARMWKQSLNIETEIVIKETAELEDARRSGDYDLIRRNAVFPTANELMSILSILKPPGSESSVPPPAGIETGIEAADPARAEETPSDREPVDAPDVTMSEANAVYELWAIPLYFPTSYSLVKPYVTGFEVNSLDAPLLHEISIDSDWQPK